MRGLTYANTSKPLLQQLNEEQVIRVQRCEDGSFSLWERCGDWFGLNMDREQLIQLAGELRALAGEDEKT
ncbi:hypothetical protein [Allohahella sp. A8]|uniref:hypothetical protein n=1 Tax=Allohahella sp. A8 TaxID=3141461 RepID=UPI003A7F8E8D